jgi:hypothetical protein
MVPAVFSKDTTERAKITVQLESSSSTGSSLCMMLRNKALSNQATVFEALVLWFLVTERMHAVTYSTCWPVT